MISSIRNKLIVSCQALEDEYLHGPEIMLAMALSAVKGGAGAIRAQGVEDVAIIKRRMQVPVIGIIKKAYADSEVYITPTQKEVAALLETNCDIIALDATQRKRPNNESLANLVTQIHEAGVLAMADCSTIEEAIYASELGFDMISSTLSGYTPYSPQSSEPDFELVKQMVARISVPIIAEGKVYSPEIARKMIEIGARAVVVGGAITRPTEITKRFVDELQ